MSEVQREAREAYQARSGRKARQRRAKERAAHWASLTVVERAAYTSGLEGSKFAEVRDLNNREAIELLGRMVAPKVGA